MQDLTEYVRRANELLQDISESKATFVPVDRVVALAQDLFEVCGILNEPHEDGVSDDKFQGLPSVAAESTAFLLRLSRDMQGKKDK